MILTDFFPSQSDRIFNVDRSIFPPSQIDMFTQPELKSFFNNYVGRTSYELVVLSWDNLTLFTDLHQTPPTVRRHPSGSTGVFLLPTPPTLLHLYNNRETSFDRRIIVRKGSGIQWRDITWRLCYVDVEEGQIHLYYDTTESLAPTLLRITVPAMTMLTPGDSFYEVRRVED
jgi:hypothetical protein